MKTNIVIYCLLHLLYFLTLTRIMCIKLSPHERHKSRQKKNRIFESDFL